MKNKPENQILVSGQEVQSNRRRWRLTHLMRWTTMGVLLVTVAAIMLGMFGYLYFDCRRDIRDVRDKLTEQTKALMREHVERAVEFIDFVRAEFDWPKEKKQALIKKRLDQISYAEGQGYIFVDNYDGYLLINPNAPHLVGKDLWEFEDVNGVKIAQVIIAAAKQGTGFISYVYVHPITKKNTEKITYVHGIDDWQWAVCSGLYIPDIDLAIAERQKTLRKDMYRYGLIILSVAIPAMCLFVIAWLYISMCINRELYRLKSDIIAGSETYVDLEPETYKIQEFAVIADGANKAFSTITEMTDKLYKEQQVTIESEEKLRRVTDNLLESFVYRHDVEGNFTYVSSSVTKVLGYLPEEFLTYYTEYYTDDPINAEACEHTELSIKGVQQPSYELQIYHKDGSVRWFEVAETPVKDASGNVIVVEGIAHDITDRKCAEREREELLKALKSKNDELQSIVYIASHDLKSPLVNIQGFSAMLNESCIEIVETLKGVGISDEVTQRVLALANEEIPESLKFISSSTDKIKMLLDGLLQVSRVGTMKIKIEPLDMNSIINSVCEAMEFQVHEADVEITIDHLPDCLGDANQINQAFSNLAGNALKYLDHDRKGKIHISGTVSESQSIYCVEDNGIGIHPDHQYKVFQLFHRLNPDDAVGGEGLGLTIVTRILDRNNGTVWLESEPGVGCKFFVSLPIA